MRFAVAPEEYVRREFPQSDCYEQSDQQIRPLPKSKRRRTMTKNISDAIVRYVVGFRFFLFRAKYYCKIKQVSTYYCRVKYLKGNGRQYQWPSVVPSYHLP